MIAAVSYSWTYGIESSTSSHFTPDDIYTSMSISLCGWYEEHKTDTKGEQNIPTKIKSYHHLKEDGQGTCQRSARMLKFFWQHRLAEDP